MSLSIPFITHAQLVEYDGEDTILFTGALSGLQKSQSTIGFFYGGNNFGGLIFLRTPQTLGTPETVEVNSSTKICTKQLRGIYYNNQRGMRFWPLDQDTLTILKTLTGAYDTLQITGGLFIGCTAPTDTYVYGNITYIRSGNTYELIAGTQFQFSTNQYIPAFAKTLQFISTISGDILSGNLRDNYGGIGLVWGSGDNIFTVNVKAFPSNRISRNTYDNNMNTGILKIYDSNKTLFFTSQSFILNSVGTGEVTINVPAGIYYVVFKGESHLASYLSGIIIDGIGEKIFDFTTGDNLYNAQAVNSQEDDGYRYQTAGDLKSSNGLYDYTINGSDISIITASGFMESGIGVLDPRNLNGDTAINVSDISVIGANFDKYDPFFEDLSIVKIFNW